MKTTFAKRFQPLVVRILCMGVAFVLPVTVARAEPQHAIAMHGEPKYAAGFAHFGYVNPDAPKGGRLVLGVQGSVFDSVNPLIVKGNPAPGMREYVFESLMTRSQDEPFTLYGLLAESIDVPDDRSSVTFTLRPEARFSDGQPVTVDDVIFSMELLREKGRPNHRSYYAKIGRVERIGERGVRMIFKEGGDREMPLIMGLMPVLPMHLIDRKTFDRTSLTIPVGSGPYVVTAIDPGVSITFKRNPEYWGRDLAVNRGLYNFAEIKFEFFRDRVSSFEAFKKGLYHFTTENEPARWAREYDFPAVTDGRVVKGAFDIGVPSGMLGLVFNTRRPVFADIRVRQALNLLFDFEWMNKNLYYGLYARTESYFDGSDLAATARPASPRERELLAHFPDAVSTEVMEGTFRQPVNDGSGTDRVNWRKAMKLLSEAGYDLIDSKMVHTATGRPLAFEMLAATADQEKLFVIFARTLRANGIDVTIRRADSVQYQRRKTNFDFDMIQNNWLVSLSPGNEQSYRWSAQAASTDGSFNFAGVSNPAVDAMIDAMLTAGSREDFVSAVRALDRVLLSGHYVIPLYHLPQQWVAYWRQLERPAVTPLYGIQIDTWWMNDIRQHAVRK